MYSYKRKRKKFYMTPVHFLALMIPLVLIALFYTLRNNTSVMMWWSNGGLYASVQVLSKVSSLFPFSLGEVLIVGVAVALVAFLGYRLYRFVCTGDVLLTGGHLWAGVSLCAWIWAWMCWLWNPLYYIPSFAQRSGLDVSPYPIEDLAVVTAYFAHEGATYSVEIPRDENLVFDASGTDYFKSALDLYQNLEEDYPFLQRGNVKAKSLLLSKWQSVFGFTGVYIPFTGEANINVHTPAIFHPVTIAHEMAHQRLIAPELEANFLAVVASVDSSDPIFTYSGYLFGLIQLSNALYTVERDLWMLFVEEFFTEEMSHDWQQNYYYWQQFQSPVEDVAKEVYDNFLKSNAQELGIRSYGACVDLLVSYYREDAFVWAEEVGLLSLWAEE